MAQKLTVVVMGSTGKQGGAVARGLLERGHKVRAVARDPKSSQARLLAKAGATLVAGSLEDTAAIMKALEGATSFFAMTMPSGGTDAETRQSIAAADVAKAAGVHLVFTSVGNANRQTGIPHFDSKYEVEKHIAKWAFGQRFSRPFPSWRTSISSKSSSRKGSTRRRSRRQAWGA
jgi:uncharacterized protein YbjT (DUF2867 family)